MERINKIIEEQIGNLQQLKDGDFKNKIMKISDMIIKSLKNGGKILMAGNGGSASDAQHFAGEIVGRFHEVKDFEEIGKWLKGAKRYFLQNFEDHGTCISEGLSAHEQTILEQMKKTVEPYVGYCQVRGVEE